MTWDEADPEDEASSSSPSRFVERMLGADGWDRRDDDWVGFTDCDGNMQVFNDAVLELRALLEKDRVRADTNREIIALTQMVDEPWARYVDPALSMPKTSPTSGSLIVMWECPDHSIGLHDRGQQRWKLVVGMEEILDMQAFLGIPDDDGVSDLDEEVATLPPIGTDLSEEDLERRKLLSRQRREALEAGEVDDL